MATLFQGPNPKLVPFTHVWTEQELIEITRDCFCKEGEYANQIVCLHKPPKKTRRSVTQNHKTMNETVLQRIIAFVIGHKYYANIIRTKGLGGTVDLTSFIHPTKADALAHRRDIEQTASYSYVETISFRSRETYVKTISQDGVRTGQQIK